MMFSHPVDVWSRLGGTILDANGFQQTVGSAEVPTSGQELSSLLEQKDPGSPLLKQHLNFLLSNSGPEPLWFYNHNCIC